MLSHSRGEDRYRGVNESDLRSSVTGLYPYARYALNDLVTAWGTAGYGKGSVTLTPEGGTALKTEMDLAMAGVGLHG